MDHLSNPSLFSKFRIQKRLKPQNYPIQNKVLYRQGNDMYKIGAAAMQGFRENMEDSHAVILKLENHSETALFGVFDGHSGPLASKWIAQNIATKLDALEEFTEESLTKACVSADADLLRELPEADTHGSTAVFALVTKDDKDEEKPWLVQCCNLGDSRLIIGRYDGSELTQVSQDHKPTQEKEMARIQKAGGFIARNRIDACLAVSRAFGDGSYKTNTELSAIEQKVSPEPDVFQERVGPNDFLFICCDGIFEAMTNEEAIEHLTNGMKEEEDLALLLSSFLQKVLEGGSLGGSRDNMTAMIIELKDGSDYAQEEEFVVGEWYSGGNEGYQAAFSENCRWYGKDPAEVKKLWLAKSTDGSANSPRDESLSDEPSDGSLRQSKKKRHHKKKGKGDEHSSEERNTPRKRRLKNEDSSTELGAHKGSSKGLLNVKGNGKLASLGGVSSNKGDRADSLADFVEKFGGQFAAEAILEANGIVHILDSSRKK
eukprot:TRINITY_DN958_c1_g1_i2.p1 TRINITY_DN958_c1_g1~~TRINITY_DN958_c1_g1_i2.p1  ORF type:complete len:487 (+),score=121.03 TRINITY_DN958_c1_g1_i2:232-1692(+)